MFEAKFSTIKNNNSGTHIKVRLYDTVVSVVNKQNPITLEYLDVNEYTRTLIEEQTYTIAKDSAKSAVIDDLRLRMIDMISQGGDSPDLGYTEEDIYVTL